MGDFYVGCFMLLEVPVPFVNGRQIMLQVSLRLPECYGFALKLNIPFAIAAQPAEDNPVLCQRSHCDDLVDILQAADISVHVFQVCLADAHSSVARAVTHSDPLHARLPRNAVDSILLVQCDAESCAARTVEGGAQRADTGGWRPQHFEQQVGRHLGWTHTQTSQHFAARFKLSEPSIKSRFIILFLQNILNFFSGLL